MRCRGLNMIEVLVAVCLIAVLAVVSLPMLSRANGEARSAACRANLMTLGQALADYRQAHGRLPALMNRDDRSLDVPTLDTALLLHESHRSALHCPSDSTRAFERTGTSYGWFAAWEFRDGHPFGEDARLNLPILADKAPFHTDQEHPYNALLPIDAAESGNAPPFIATPYAMPY